MTGYVSWKDIRDEREREEKAVSIVVWLAEVVAATALVWIMLATGCDTADATAKKSRKPEPVYTAQVHYFSQPAAFRLATPTPEQMDQLHAMLTINQVQHPERIVTNDE